MNDKALETVKTVSERIEARLALLTANYVTLGLPAKEAQRAAKADMEQFGPDQGLRLAA